MGRQADLPGFEKPKRKPPRIMAKVHDAGCEWGKLVVYRCDKCGWTSDWINEGDKPDSEIIRGHACPVCNREPSND